MLLVLIRSLRKKVRKTQTQKVAIIHAGHWGNLSATSRDYSEMVERLEQWLKEAKWTTDDQLCAEVLVVTNTEDALAWVGGRGAIIYITRGKAEEAKRVAEEHPHIRVTLFTGLIPDREVVFFEKSWIRSAEQVRDVVLR